MSRPLSRNQLIFLIAVDLLVLLVVTWLGFATHDRSLADGRWLTTFIPLVFSWFLAAPWLGLYRAGAADRVQDFWRPGLAAALAAPLAVGAGHDLLLVCRDRTAQREAFDSLLWAARKKELKLREIEESAERIQKKGFSGIRTPLPGEKFETAKGEALARSMAQGAATILGDGRGLIPFSSGSFLKGGTALFPDLKETARERFVEPELLNPSDFIRKTFLTFKYPLASVRSIPLNPSEEEQKKIQGNLKGDETLFFFLWDAHLFEGARGLLSLLQRKTGRLVVVLLREPRDFEGVSEKSACVTAYGYHKDQIEAAVGKIFSAS